jgi:apolipoprotein D and lipocalin family protein
MKHTFLTLLLLLITGCSAALPPLKTVEKVDIARFMGPWYVIACISTFIETEAFNGIETYRLEPDGSIDTVFTFNKGSFDGTPKRHNPRGFIVDSVNNSTWGMQFIWPFKAEFLITYLNKEYSQTVIARNKRDYVWIMARTPQIPEADYLRLVKGLEGQGYDISRLRKVPQRWPNDSAAHE